MAAVRWFHPPGADSYGPLLGGIGMRIEYGFKGLLLTSHAGLPSLAQVLKAARLRTALGPSLRTVPHADVFIAATALLSLGKCHFESVLRKWGKYRSPTRVVRAKSAGFRQECSRAPSCAATRAAASNSTRWRCP